RDIAPGRLVGRHGTRHRRERAGDAATTEPRRDRGSTVPGHSGSGEPDRRAVRRRPESAFARWPGVVAHPAAAGSTAGRRAETASIVDQPDPHTDDGWAAAELRSDIRVTWRWQVPHTRGEHASAE